MTESGVGNAGGIAHVGVIDFDSDTLVKDTFTITATCTDGCEGDPSDTDEFVTAGPVVDVTVDGPANIDVDMDAVYTASGWDLDGDPVADGTTTSWISTSSRILFKTAGGLQGLQGNAVDTDTAGGRAVITALALSQGATEIVVSMGSVDAIYHITVDADDAVDGGRRG